MNIYTSPHVMQLADTLIDMRDLDNLMMTPREIAQSLSNQVRFNGSLSSDPRHQWTVAHHILAMGTAASLNEEPESVRRVIDLHDVHEVITGDIPSPVKRLLGNYITEIELRIDKAVYTQFGVERTEDNLRICRAYDNAMWQAELAVIGGREPPPVLPEHFSHCSSAIESMEVMSAHSARRTLQMKLEAML